MIFRTALLLMFCIPAIGEEPARKIAAFSSYMRSANGLDAAQKISAFKIHVASIGASTIEAETAIEKFKDSLVEESTLTERSTTPTALTRANQRTAVVASGFFGEVESGLVSFRFRGQVWPDVLDWCSTISKRTFVWRELPSSRVFASVRQPVSTTEALGIVAKALHSQGFGMTCDADGETVTVFDLGEQQGVQMGLVDLSELYKLPSWFMAKMSISSSRIRATNVAREISQVAGKHVAIKIVPSANKIVVTATTKELREWYWQFRFAGN